MCAASTHRHMCAEGFFQWRESTAAGVRQIQPFNMVLWQYCTGGKLQHVSTSYKYNGKSGVRLE